MRLKFLFKYFQMMDGRNIAVGWFAPVKCFSSQIKRANLIEGSSFDNKYRRITFKSGTTTFSINNLKKCHYAMSHVSFIVSLQVIVLSVFLLNVITPAYAFITI